MSFNSMDLLSVSCHSLESIEQEIKLATIWTAFSKCKPYIEQGQRLENIAWRLWRKDNHSVDNKTIKRHITSILLSPATIIVHDDVPQQCYTINQKCDERLFFSQLPKEEEKLSSSFCSSVVLVEKEKRKDEKKQKVKVIVVDDDDDDDDDYDYDDEDEEDDDDDDDIIYEFKKTQPVRPTTPRRSLLSDLFNSSISSSNNSKPPSLLSSFTSTNHSSLLIEDSQHANNNLKPSFYHFLPNTTTSVSNEPSNITTTINHEPSNTTTKNEGIEWRESFHDCW